jgi:hypothetical protein
MNTISVYLLYVDFKQAFDSTGRFHVIEAVEEFGTPAKLIFLTKITLSRIYNKVNIQKTLSRSFRTECGIRKGDSICILLFNTGLDGVMINIEINPCGTIFNRTRQFIAYADDEAVTGRTVGAPNEVLMQLQTAVLSTGLVINNDKTKHMKAK